jgi:hypothetical protein
VEDVIPVGDDNPARWLLTREHLDALASLTDVQRDAVRFALFEWHAVAQGENYHPNQFWDGFPSYVAHSAARGRLMAGLPLFVGRPPKGSGGYPDYKAMKRAGAAVRIRPPDPDLI